MKALIQRVSCADVKISGEVVGKIEQGLLVLLGVEAADTEATANKMLEKLLRYRVFNDEQGKMNLSLQDVSGGMLVVSQFTLAADTNKGLRPSFSSAAAPEQAKKLYHHFLQQAQQAHQPVASGVFAADMQVSLVNDGPVTFLLECE